MLATRQEDPERAYNWITRILAHKQILSLYVPVRIAQHNFPPKFRDLPVHSLDDQRPADASIRHVLRPAAGRTPRCMTESVQRCRTSHDGGITTTDSSVHDTPKLSMPIRWLRQSQQPGSGLCPARAPPSPWSAWQENRQAPSRCHLCLEYACRI
jgi:hypothetical protein